MGRHTSGLCTGQLISFLQVTKLCLDPHCGVTSFQHCASCVLMSLYFALIFDLPFQQLTGRHSWNSQSTLQGQTGRLLCHGQQLPPGSIAFPLSCHLLPDMNCFSADFF